MSYPAIPGQRLVISNAELIRCTSYERENRVLWRHWFRTPQGPVVYTGTMLPVATGQIVTVKGTCKRFEQVYGESVMRISRPKIICGFDTKKVDRLGLLI